MPGALTRSMSEEIFVYMDKKFEELKDLFITNLKDELMCEIKNEMKTFIGKVNDKIEKLDSTVSILQTHVNLLKQQNDDLMLKLDDTEQYGRRLCLRIDGIPCEDTETADDVLDKVKEQFTEAEVSIPEEVIDRAHRISKPYKDRESGVKCQQIIVRFTTFRHRTRFYKARKKLKNNVHIRLDLTKLRYGILKGAAREVHDNDKVKFVYADVNCRLKVHLNLEMSSFSHHVMN